MKSPLKTYTDNQYGHRAQSNNLLEQTTLLYQLLLDDFDQCLGCIERGDITGRGETINHVTAVLSALGELALSMSAPDQRPSEAADTSESQPLASLLSELYSHCLFLVSTIIVEPDQENNIAAIKEAWSMINHVKSSWDELSRQFSTSLQSEQVL